MAIQSDSPPNSIDEKPQNPVSQVPQPTIDDRQNAKGEAAKESSPTSVFVNSEPIREEQVQNAVKFLSHPKVRGSPVLYRRSFLERKGLTKEEMDEAFRRVPDPTPAVNTTEPRVIIQDGHIKSSSNIQPQAPTQSLQPAQVAPAGSNSRMETLTRFHWSHALLAVGFLAVSGAGTAVLFKNALIPRVKTWVRKVVLEEEGEDLLKRNNMKASLAEDVTAAAKAAAAAAADVARTSQEMLMSKTEERRLFEELINMLNMQVREMRSMSNVIQKVEDQRVVHERIPAEEQDDQRVSQSSSRLPYANGRMNDDPYSVRSLPPPASVEPSVVAHPQSYMEGINDSPPNPNTVPWLQRRNVRITEIETVDDERFGSSNVASNERPVQRSWMPPQPPPVAMPEAAAAIRQPKKPSFLKEQLTDDQLLACSSDVTDELQRITRISESGGVVESNGETSGLNSNEMQSEEDKSTSKHD